MKCPVHPDVTMNVVCDEDVCGLCWLEVELPKLPKMRPAGQVAPVRPMSKKDAHRQAVYAENTRRVAAGEAR